MNTLIMMAGGTGGHVYPGLAVAKALREVGVNVIWMGVRGGIEDRVAKQEGFVIDYIRVKGLWNSGILRWISLPVWITYSIIQCCVIILHRRPDVLVGMGGFVCAPGGIAAYLLRRPFLIHESNAVAGMTNQILAYLSTRVLIGFAETKIAGKPEQVGTPVREEIIQASLNKPETLTEDKPLQLLILGGSQGAKALNNNLPRVLKSLPVKMRPKVIHQTGRGRANDVEALYKKNGVEAEVREFIDDMANVYTKSDLVVSRAGAMTIAEVSVMGLAAIFVPYPYAARNHQYLNAKQLERAASALICTENDDFVTTLSWHLEKVLGQRSVIAELSKRIRKFASVDATELVVKHCFELMEVKRHSTT